MWFSVSKTCWCQGLMSKDWSNSTAVAKAFSIGPQEAKAVANLQSHVEPFLVKELKACVATRGMRSFLTHDVLGKGLFNTGYTSASGTCEAWVSALTNTEDGETDPWSFVFILDAELVGINWN